MRATLSSLFVGTLLLVCSPSRAQAEQRSDSPVMQAELPEGDCQSLPSRLGAGYVEKIEASTVEAGEGSPAYCRVTGVVLPSIGFEMRLPIRGWNGKFYQAGCGGFCGQVLPDANGYSNGIGVAVRRGYAAIVTDSGHTGSSPGDATWAVDQEAVELFAHRWVPLAYSAGHTIAKKFYGDAPRLSYFSGCSNGGRVALIAAQRYPRLFNGIISGCPVLDLTGSGGIFGAWKLQTNRDSTAPVLGSAFNRKLSFLAEQVRMQCDARDGRSDGLISQLGCPVDVAAIPGCASAADGDTSSQCLTAEEKRVVAQWFGGPADSSGRQLFGGMPPGSEFYWTIWYLQDPSQAIGTQLAEGFTRYLAFSEKDPSYSAASFDFDADPARMTASASLLNATDPDISEFRDNGGKLLLWHGMADALVVPSQSVDYYQWVLERMGGPQQVQSFFRLFLAPGLGHCWEAPSPTAPEDFDPLTAIEEWVEQGQAPDVLVARSSARQGDLAVSEIHYRPYRAGPNVLDGAQFDGPDQ
ncbi:tannase/feruloyl esterase family alpha/beta hydrolase [Altererythrobacter arenosus]|uniref:Tannase/feruloyl esterase family alpha/beta hydrolase n=1 Tax=Altererythrobacter arenosus TaxID=3032592 RepID=A0ABY8FMR7_9SPHN|nr:tannase/feruloyl esterase family alpha/beta hydrolase [Altererythrobacter sp. CAU 1644]WFL76316.1 tannase/feruloyl esterase family alpha/beta hydrolase [Altererythrobacter sp. CAU 1644]